MSLLKTLNAYKDLECYGPFCSKKSCGLYKDCNQTKSSSTFWYPDCLKDRYIKHENRRGLKTCDLLACTNSGIYFIELKPEHGTKYVKAKIEGTYKLLTNLYTKLNDHDISMIKCFLISCYNGLDPNRHFKTTMNFLTQKNNTGSLYDNGKTTINNIEIPISYHHTCTDFINEGLDSYFI